MDTLNFDALTRSLGKFKTRRRLVQGAASGLLAVLLGGATPGSSAAAPLPNGQPCRRGSQCSSGYCKGPRGRRRCRQAPGQGICTIASNAGASPPVLTDCARAGSGERCACWVTTAGRSFCGERAPASCGCGANNDCATSEPGAVCVQNPRGAFGGCGLACVFPCRAPA